jgi:putative tryptophan/tyrosine transport system substrate-binding protein
VSSRREVITLLGGAAAWPIARPNDARGQQATKFPTIGFIGSATASTQGQEVAHFAQRLRELGWIGGRSLAIEYRWAEGHKERALEVAAKFVRLKVDVIVTVGTPTTAAAKQATSVIPIVFIMASDPVGSGFVASLPRPGGNVTGLSNQATDTATKRLELLRDLVPNLRRIAIMGNPGNPANLQEIGEVHTAAGKLDLADATFEIRRPQDISPAFEALKRGGAEALYVAADGLAISNRVRINTFALVAKLPTMHGNREMLEGGSLISYGANAPYLFGRAGDLVDKVLRGRKPADIPVEQPTKFDLIVNLVTAEALAVDVPSTLLARANEVIE